MLKKRLGRGLDSLIPQAEAPAAMPDRRGIEIARIQPNPYQPRREFSPGELDELRRSIGEKGLLQPILVRQTPDGFQIVAGERRLRACRELGWETIPGTVVDVPDGQMLEVALVENLQRQDLNAIEKALAFRQLIDTFHLTHEEAALRVAVDRSSVTNHLRLLDLPERVREHVAEGRLSMGHARALLALPPTEDKERAADRVLARQLSVRETERLCSNRSGKRGVSGRREPAGDDDHRIRHLERELEQALATKVRITRQKVGGQIVIDFYTDAEFSRLQGILLSRA